MFKINIRRFESTVVLDNRKIMLWMNRNDPVVIRVPGLQFTPLGVRALFFSRCGSVIVVFLWMCVHEKYLSVLDSIPSFSASVIVSPKTSGYRIIRGSTSTSNKSTQTTSRFAKRSICFHYFYLILIVDRLIFLYMSIIKRKHNKAWTLWERQDPIDSSREAVEKIKNVNLQGKQMWAIIFEIRDNECSALNWLQFILWFFCCNIFPFHLNTFLNGLTSSRFGTLFLFHFINEVSSLQYQQPITLVFFHFLSSRCWLWEMLSVERLQSFADSLPTALRRPTIPLCVSSSSHHLIVPK